MTYTSAHLRRVFRIYAVFNAFLLAVCLSPTAAFSAPPNGVPYTGVLPGEFNVSPTGAATYSIPVEIPPGIGGLQPQLSLEYSSQAGNGLLGVGWSLGGMSVTTRCPATLAQDNFLDPVDFDSNDRLCLDGQRLVPVTNIGCAGGTEYRTEIDTYARICAYGTQGSGPAWLKMWTKAGQVMEYGATADARVEAQGRNDVLVWAVNKVSDTVGNYFTVTYHENNANGEYYPLRIDYTGNTNRGMAPYHSVHFLYEQRPDQASGWIGGSITRSRVRMTNIQVYAGPGLVRDYRFAYETSSMTARSRLTSLMQCTGAGYGAICQPATGLTWSNGTAGFAPAVSTGRSGTGYQYAHALDINADGKMDLAYCTNAASYWQILISNGNGFNAPISTGVLCTNFQYAMQIDYDSDGRTDLLVPYANSRWYVLRSTGAGFSVIDTGMPNFGWNTRPVVTDINGDGRQDLVLAHSSQWVIRINNGNGFNAAVMTGINNVNWQYRLEIDYDGDGMMDLLVPYANNRWYVLRSTGNSFQLVDTQISSVGYDNKPQILDVNGDGYQDLVVSHSGRIWISLNRGGSLSPGVDAGVPDIRNPASYHKLDYDGDGKDDLFASYSVGGTCAPGRVCAATFYPGWSILRSHGNSFELMDVPHAVFAALRAGDFNGDGFIDIALDGSVWNLLLHSPGIPDQLNTITNGADGVIEITYKPLTDASVYTKGVIQAYPQQGLQAPLYVVSEYSASNGVGGTNTRHYTYADARVDLRGRGFLGFRTVTAVDDASQIRTQTTYDQTFPYVGFVTSVDTRRVGASVPLKMVTNAWSNNQPFTGVYQVRVSYSVENVYELDGTYVTALSTVYNLYDTHGNAQQVDVYSIGGGYNHKATISTYTNDVTQWHLGRLTRSQVTSTGSSGSGTRTSAFEYDLITGLLTAEIIEPDDPQLMLRTEYGHDGYGNRTSVTVRDSGGNSYPITAATSTTNYDYSGLAGYGIYTITGTNAKGHTETRVIDAHSGKPLSLTGPNGFTTQWQYDSFGHQTREIRADGTRTDTAMTWCSSTCAGVAHATYEMTVQNSGSAAVTVYYDSLGRELRSETVSLSGRVIFKDIQYDHLGRIMRVSRPYFATSTPRWTDYQYDALGRIWKETSPAGGIVETTYKGLTTSIRRYDVNATYDQTVVRNTNVEGNLSQVIDEGYQRTYYQYDPFGNLTRVTDPAGNATLMTYDIRGRKLTMNEPNMGTWEYRYDALGRLRWQKDAKNQVTTMEYDALGRMTRRVQPEGAATWSYDDSPTPGIGKLWKVTGPNGYLETHYYDFKGRPFVDNLMIAGTSFSTVRSYDGFGRVNAFMYPSGFILKHDYNANGYMYQISSANNSNEVYWTAQETSSDGQITQELLGNGLTTVRTFDPASGHLSYLGTYGGTANVQMLSYQYDALGSLRGREDVVQGLSETFQYDAFNRLVQADIAGAGTKTWSYDGLGNITSKDGYSDYAYTSGRPHAVSYARGSTHVYDANGNLQVSYGTQTRYIIWNSANLPTRIWANNNTVVFSYTPDGARYRQVAAANGVSTTTLYAGSYHEQMTRNGVTTHKDYIAAYGRVVAVREITNGTATVKYLHQDHLGSTDMITDATGQVLERQSFDAFGSRRIATTWRDPVAALTGLFSTRGFTGHEQLDAVGLIHMNGRVYDPQLGRFLSADPMVQHLAGAQGLNRYSYTDNNPLSRVDPSGYGWLSKAWKKVKRAVKKVFRNPVVRAVAAVAASVATFGYAGLLTSSPFWGAAAGGFVGGTIATGTLKGGLVGAFTAGAFYGVGSWAGAWHWSAKTLAHGVVGGTSSVASGGRFKEGFMGAGFTQFASPTLGRVSGDAVGRTVAAAVVGGTAAELGGGKFANGAQTAAFSYLFSSAASGQGGSLGNAVRGFGRGVARVAKVLAVDVQALVVGQVGAVGTFFQDVAGVGSSLFNLDIIGAGKGAFMTVFDAIVPNYGYYGGAGWGTRQFGTDGVPVPLNRVDWASFRHDISFRHSEWVRDVWSGDMPGVPAGPIGQAYKLLGTVPFSAAGALQ